MTAASGMSTVKSKNTMKAGLAVETMSAPNPFCPNTKGVCCLMVLTNLSLILICIGFIIVLQLTDPPVVWLVDSSHYHLFHIAFLPQEYWYCDSSSWYC